MKKIIYSTIIALIIPFLSPCQNWQGLGTGTSIEVYCLYTDTTTNALNAGGQFNIGGVPYLGIAKWNGIVWDSIGSGLPCFPLFDIIRYKNEIYVAGGNGGGINKWNGSSWVSVGSGLNIIGTVSPIAYHFSIYNSELYVGGGFDTAGNVPANSLAKWNDTTWTDVHSLPCYDITQNGINSIIMYQGEMYASGYFDGIGNDIVKWDGTAWQTVGGGIQGVMDLAAIYDMAIYNNELYVAGTFTTFEGNVGNLIQKWNGTSWSDVGGGMEGITLGGAEIHKLIVFHNKLYAMGLFSQAGGIPASNIASWDGTNWCSLGSTFIGEIYGGAVYNDTLYIGGDFATIDGNSLNHIVKWTGGNYVDTCGHINVGVNEIETSDEVNIYPNPATNQLIVNSEQLLVKEIKIYNVLGEMILNDPETSSGQNDKSVKIDVSGLANGMYFIKLEFENTSISKKFIKN